MGAGASSASKKREERNGRRSGRKEAWKDKNERVVNDHESLAAMGYRLTKTIGKGSYGKVKKAVSAKHGSNVAVKIIDCSKKNHKHHARFFRREKQVTCFANHPNIVKCYEVVDCKNKIYIMLEYVENGDLCRSVVFSVDCPVEIYWKVLWKFLGSFHWLSQRKWTEFHSL